MNRIRHEGTCVRCHTECSRDSDGIWYNFYGRDQCKLDPDEGPHIVRDFTEVEVEPEPCFHAGAVPVDSLSGERVAWLCPACDQQMDAGWQPPEPLQFVVELTVESKPGAEIPLLEPPGATVEFYPVSETSSLIMIRGTLARP